MSSYKHPQIAVAIVTLLAMVVSAAVRPTTETPSVDEEEIRAVVQSYFTGVTENDLGAVEAAFHPQAWLWASLSEDRLYRREFERWKRFTDRDPSDRRDEFENTIASIDITGSAAVAKVDLKWPGIHYVDYLSLVKHQGRWAIVNKIWHQERLND